MCDFLASYLTGIFNYTIINFEKLILLQYCQECTTPLKLLKVQWLYVLNIFLYNAIPLIIILSPNFPWFYSFITQMVFNRWDCLIRSFCRRGHLKISNALWRKEGLRLHYGEWKRAGLRYETLEWIGSAEFHKSKMASTCKLMISHQRVVDLLKVRY